MSSLGDLYQEVILDHNRRPRNFRVLEDARQKAEGYNPLCGDHLTLYLKVDENMIRQIGFQGSGCAIFKSSASMMTDSVKGKSTVQAQALFENFRKMLSGGLNEPYDKDLLGKLTVFAGVREYPVRIKCATLAWHTLKAGLENSRQPVTTEDNVG